MCNDVVRTTARGIAIGLVRGGWTAFGYIYTIQDQHRTALEHKLGRSATQDELQLFLQQMRERLDEQRPG